MRRSLFRDNTAALALSALLVAGCADSDPKVAFDAGPAWDLPLSFADSGHDLGQADTAPPLPDTPITPDVPTWPDIPAFDAGQPTPDPGITTPDIPPDPGVTMPDVPPDPGVGIPDPGQPDPGVPDPGQPDPGAPDPGAPDPGPPDPGAPDPGPQDVPTDAGGSGVCLAFAEPDECAAGSWCEPDARDPATGVLMGTCVPIEGTVAAGATCDVEGCDAGLACMPSSAQVDVCFLYCDPEQETLDGPGDCPGSYTCVVLPETDVNNDITAIPDWGICSPGCIPWTPEGEAACPGQWCSPYIFNAEDGACEDIDGTAAEGELCGVDPPAAATTCGAGLICVNSACGLMCNADAAPGQPGATCGATATCASLILTGANDATFALDVGFCQGACQFHEGTPCPDASQSCSPGELFEQAEDLCLTPNADMPLWPMPEFELCPASAQAGTLCGPNSVCLELAWIGGAGLRCYDICVTTAGPFNQPNHPDCRRDSALCEDLFTGSPPFGVCGEDFI